MIVWLASYPRSGNTLLRLVIRHAFGLPTYSVYDDPLFEELGASQVVGHRPLPAPLEELAHRDEPFLVKTHELPSDDRPAIHIVRDGRDALVSFARFIEEFEPPPGQPTARVGERRTDILRDLVETDARYGGWSPHVLAWLGRPAARTATVRFEDLLRRPVDEVADAVRGVGLTPSPAGSGPPSFEDLHRRWPNFFRSGQVGSWRREMSWRLHRRFWRRHGAAMRALGYPRRGVGPGRPS